MIKILRPEGMELPPEYNEGDSMTALAEITVEGDTITLNTIEGTEVSEVVTEEEEEVDELPPTDELPPEEMEDEIGPGGIPAGITNFVQGQLNKRSQGPGGMV